MEALEAARLAVAGVDANAAAFRAGGVYEGEPEAGVVEIPFFGSPVCINVPGYELQTGSAWVPPHVQALILYYLAMTDGTPPSGEIISFLELPDARFYATAYQGYTGDALVRALGPTADERLGLAVARLGGSAVAGFPSDGSWLIPALPRVPVVLTWWNADDEFGARAEMLFDRTAPRHLTTDGCAVLCSWLTHCLIQQAT